MRENVVTTAPARPLGERQLTCLKNLERGKQYPGGGWIYSQHATTVAIIETLVERGLAVRTETTEQIGLNTRVRAVYTAASETGA